MSVPRKRRCAPPSQSSVPHQAPLEGQAESSATNFLTRLFTCQPFNQLDTKIACARAQGEPVLYAHVLPGLDLLLCTVPAAQPPYLDVNELRIRCIESVADALEQPLVGLQRGGYWYEISGLGLLIFASDVRPRVLAEFSEHGIRDNLK